MKPTEFENLKKRVQRARATYYFSGVNVILQRRGIGTRFKRIIEEIARQRGGGLLYTNSSNPANMRILKKLGWEKLFFNGEDWFYFKTVRGR